MDIEPDEELSPSKSTSTNLLSVENEDYRYVLAAELAGCIVKKLKFNLELERELKRSSLQILDACVTNTIVFLPVFTVFDS